MGEDDLMPQILWTICFLEAQGMNISDNVVYQDNQCARKPEKNRRASSGNKIRHINIRYYFVTYCIQANEMKV